MTVLSLEPAARLNLLHGRSTSAIKAGRSSAIAQDRYLMAQQFGNVRVTGIASRRREFAGGFVDLLLGRGARTPR